MEAGVGCANTRGLAYVALFTLYRRAVAVKQKISDLRNLERCSYLCLHETRHDHTASRRRAPHL